jgi:hypothetical protein
MSWPPPASRAYDPADTEAKKEKEFDDGVDMDNAILDECIEQETRITALQTNFDELDLSSVGLRSGLVVTEGPTPASDLRIIAAALSMDDNIEITRDVNVVADIGSDLETGLTLTADTFYYVFIQHDSTGTEDDRGLFSTSLVPTKHDGYDGYTLVYQILTDSASEIVPSIHIPEESSVIISSPEEAGKTALMNINNMTLTTTWANFDLSVMQPPGVDRILVKFKLETNITASGFHALYMKPTWAGDIGTGKTRQRMVFFAKTIPLGEFVHTDPTWAYLDINGQIALAEGINEGGSGTWQEWNDTDVWLAGWKLPF